MATADNGTQERIFQRLAEAGVGTSQIAGWLGVADCVVSDYKAGRRTLPPWAMARIAKRMQDAGPVVEDIVSAAGQHLGEGGEVYDPDDDPQALAFELHEAIMEYASQFAQDIRPGSDRGATLSPAELARQGEFLPRIENLTRRQRAATRRAQLALPMPRRGAA